MKITMRRTLALYTFVCAVLAFALVGCGPEDAKRESLKSANRVEVFLDAGFDTVENLRQNNLVSPDKEKTSIKQIQKVNKAVLVFNERAKAINPGNITGDDKQALVDAWSEVLNGLNDPAILAAAGVKNPITKQTLEVSINAAIGVANSIMNTLRKIKPVKLKPPAGAQNPLASPSLALATGGVI